MASESLGSFIRVTPGEIIFIVAPTSIQDLPLPTLKLGSLGRLLGRHQAGFLCYLSGSYDVGKGRVHDIGTISARKDIDPALAETMYQYW